MKYIKIMVIVSFVLFACSKDDKEPKKELFATAHVTIGNGIEFDFKGDKSTGVSASGTKLGLGFLDSESGHYLYLAVTATEGLKEATYTLQVKDAVKDGVVANVTLDPDKALAPESFDTKWDIDGDLWNDGTGSITITSLKGNRVEGTFSAVAYSESGNEARITDGKFKAEVKYEF